jgi:hypothetical protein
VVVDKDIQAILRHNNIGITMNIYVKSAPESQVDAMDLLEKELARDSSLEIQAEENSFIN